VQFLFLYLQAQNENYFPPIPHNPFSNMPPFALRYAVFQRAKCRLLQAKRRHFTRHWKSKR